MFKDLIWYRCLIAVCTSEGHVKIYRPPFCDYCAEWIEVCGAEVVTTAELGLIL